MKPRLPPAPFKTVKCQKCGNHKLLRDDNIWHCIFCELTDRKNKREVMTFQ